ncbi:MAG: hypothetical protein O3A46_12075 [Candidatus Poribacteria bacterium]|nr:hypothetical protein [Candidatus Poribacteria bacterium]
MAVITAHHHAMELADKADAAKRSGSNVEATALLREAFRYEKQAAMEYKDRPETEPTRSVLFRSAASLALECGELREAERMIAFGLSGNPPNAIAAELRELFERMTRPSDLTTGELNSADDGFHRVISSQKTDDDALPIWEKLRRLTADMPQEELEKLPRDGAANLDHYLYGHAKRHKP